MSSNFSRLGTLKGTASRDFIHLVYFMNHLPSLLIPVSYLRDLLVYFENSRRYWKVNGYPVGIIDTCVKFTTCINDTGGHTFPPRSKLIRVAPTENLLPVSSMPAVIATGDNHSCSPQWQTLSCCVRPKLNILKKNLSNVSTGAQQYLNQIWKQKHLLKRVSYLPPVSLTPVVHPQFRISSRNFDKKR